jgi:hypothetical protein
VDVCDRCGAAGAGRLGLADSPAQTCSLMWLARERLSRTRYDP